MTCRRCGGPLLLDIPGRDQCGRCNPITLVPDWGGVRLPPAAPPPPRIDPPPNAVRGRPGPHSWWRSTRQPLHPRCLGCYDLQPTLETVPRQRAPKGGLS